MRIGFQIFDCPVVDSVRASLHDIILSDKTYKYPPCFKGSHCAVVCGKILGSFLARHILSENILFIFSERIKAGLSLLEAKLKQNLVVNEDNKVNGKSRYGKDENKNTDGAVILINFPWNDNFRNFARDYKDKKRTDCESCEMSWGQFKMAKYSVDDFCHGHLFCTQRQG